MLPPRVRQYLYIEAATTPALVGLELVCLSLRISPAATGLIQNLLDSLVFYLLILLWDLKKSSEQIGKGKSWRTLTAACLKKLVVEFSAAEILDTVLSAILTIYLVEFSPQFGFWIAKIVMTMIFFAAAFFSHCLVRQRRGVEA